MPGTLPERRENLRRIRPALHHDGSSLGRCLAHHAAHDFANAPKQQGKGDDGDDDHGANGALVAEHVAELFVVNDQ